MVLVIAGVLLFSLAKKSVGKTAHAAAPEAAAPEAAVGSGVDGGDGFRYSHTRHLLNQYPRRLGHCSVPLSSNRPTFP